MGPSGGCEGMRLAVSALNKVSMISGPRGGLAFCGARGARWATTPQAQTRKSTCEEGLQ